MTTPKEKSKELRYALDALDLIGRTPLVKINRLTSPDDATILAKLERQNIGGSVKDRIAKYMIEFAERDGTLTRDKIILEPTSGNTGIGIAVVAAVKGYRAVFTMPESVSVERRRILEAYGAEIILTPASKGTPGAIEEGYRLAKENPTKYFLPDQFNNRYNILAHYETTGPEILEDTEGRLDAFVAGIGTSGTVMGAGKKLKEYNPKILVIGVEPVLGQRIQGMRSMKEPFPPSLFDESQLDERILVTEEQSFPVTRELALREGLLLGMSSGSVMYVALRKAKQLGRGKTIVAVLPDTGERYLSTPVFEEPKKIEQK